MAALLPTMLALAALASTAGPPPGLEAVAPLRAATELERFLFDHPHDPRRMAITARLAQAYVAAGRPQAALAVLDDAMATAPAAWRSRLGVTVGDAARVAGEPTAVIEGLVAPHLGDGVDARPAFALLARLYAERAEWERALALLGRWQAAQPADAAACAAAAAAIRAHLARPRAHEWVAGGLSAILPGSGQLYAGDPGAALASFAANGAMLGGMVRAVRQADGVGALMGLPFTLRYYAGGIIAAQARVRRTAQQDDDRFAARLQAQCPTLFERPDRPATP